MTITKPHRLPNLIRNSHHITVLSVGKSPLLTHPAEKAQPLILLAFLFTPSSPPPLYEKWVSKGEKVGGVVPAPDREKSFYRLHGWEQNPQNPQNYLSGREWSGKVKFICQNPSVKALSAPYRACTGIPDNKRPRRYNPK